MSKPAPQFLTCRDALYLACELAIERPDDACAIALHVHHEMSRHPDAHDHSVIIEAAQCLLMGLAQIGARPERSNIRFGGSVALTHSDDAN